jgi:putative DNA primase/helicase
MPNTLINTSVDASAITIESSALPLSQPLPANKSFPHKPSIGFYIYPATLDNLAFLFEQYGVVVRYNVIKKRILVIIPGLTSSVDNADNTAFTHILHLAKMNHLSTSDLAGLIDAIADKNLYNPVVDWIHSKSWDCVDRLPNIYATIETADDFPRDFKETLMRKWLMSAVAAALKPSGFKARGVLTLQGAQGIGKTSWLSSLVPDEALRFTLVKTDHHLDAGNKDSIMTAVSHWLVEIGELDSSFRKDVARLKGFLTSDSDKLRRPYARGDSEYARKTVFFASVNQEDFLVDSTGNSRFWTIPATKINYQHGIDMQQLWAQLAVLFNEGETWWLTPEEEAQLDRFNANHRSVSSLREQIQDWFDMSLLANDSKLPALTATQVLQRLDIKSPTNPQTRECGSILRELLGTPKKIRGSMKWRVPVDFDAGEDEVFPSDEPYLDPELAAEIEEFVRGMLRHHVVPLMKLRTLVINGVSKGLDKSVELVTSAVNHHPRFKGLSLLTETEDGDV